MYVVCMHSSNEEEYHMYMYVVCTHSSNVMRNQEEYLYLMYECTPLMSPGIRRSTLCMYVCTPVMSPGIRRSTICMHVCTHVMSPGIL